MTIDRRIEDASATDPGGARGRRGAGLRGPGPRAGDDARQRPGWVLPDQWMPRVVAPTIVGRRLAPAVGLLMLVLTLAAAAVYIGTRPRLPQPFGPARNGTIVYGSDGDIYTGTPDGATSRLVGGPEVDFDPFYAPDGTRIAFYRQVGDAVNGATDLMVVDRDGTGLIRLTERPLMEIPFMTEWSSDSSDCSS